MVHQCSVGAEFSRTVASTKQGTLTTENSAFYHHSQLHDASLLCTSVAKDDQIYSNFNNQARFEFLLNP